MFWADRVTDELLEQKKDSVACGKPLLVRDEKTASGRVHVGSLRSAALHALVAETLAERKIPHTFLFEINDFDPMDGLPSYLDASVYNQHMGKPLYTIPSPDGKAPNFAEYYGQEYIGVMKEIGFTPTVYRSSELYLSGKMNDVIRTALERRDTIIKIYKEESGGERPSTWYPLNVICENCGKLSTTSVLDFDGAVVSYICREKAVEWTTGCSHEGKISPFDGNAKLPWKVEWAAKFVVNGVDFEGAGKDHYTKGGSRQVANRIAKEVFEYEPPYGVANEFILVGGAKMSSSKGAGVSAREIANLVPPHILRLTLIRSDIGKQINFDPEGDTIPVLFDHYDKIATKYWAGESDDDTRVFIKSHIPGNRELLRQRFLPRFSQMAFLVQMAHLDLTTEITALKGSELTEADIAEMNMRSEYAKLWLATSAPDEFRFILQELLPAGAKEITVAQKASLREVVTALGALEVYDGQTVHTALHALKEASGLSPKDFFTPFYRAFLGKDSGPKIGWFLSTLDKEFVLARLKEMIA